MTYPRRPTVRDYARSPTTVIVHFGAQVQREGGLGRLISTKVRKRLAVSNDRPLRDKRPHERAETRFTGILRVDVPVDEAGQHDGSVVGANPDVHVQTGRHAGTLAPTSEPAVELRQLSAHPSPPAGGMLPWTGRTTREIACVLHGLVVRRRDAAKFGNSYRFTGNAVLTRRAPQG